MVQGRIIPICMDSSMTESLKEETLVTQKMSSEAYRSRKLSRKVNSVDLKCVTSSCPCFLRNPDPQTQVKATEGPETFPTLQTLEVQTSNFPDTYLPQAQKGSKP